MICSIANNEWLKNCYNLIPEIFAFSWKKTQLLWHVKLPFHIPALIYWTKREKNLEYLPGSKMQGKNLNLQCIILGQDPGVFVRFKNAFLFTD